MADETHVKGVVELAMIRGRFFAKAGSGPLGQMMRSISRGRLLLDHDASFDFADLPLMAEFLTELVVYDARGRLSVDDGCYPHLRAITVGPGKKRISIDLRRTPGLETLAVSRPMILSGCSASRLTSLQSTSEPTFAPGNSWSDLACLQRLKIANSYPSTLPPSLTDLDVYAAPLPTPLQALPRLRTLHLDHVRGLDGQRLREAYPSLDNVWVTGVTSDEKRSLEAHFGARYGDLGS